MRTVLTALSQIDRLSVDTIIDVRAPSEYAEDHLPGAINLPALSDEERVEVGTIYVQDDRFRARRIGAAHVARNVAAHLEGALSAHDGSWRPLVYCWRGGQRSGAFASILSEIGWRTSVLEGGYRSYRRLVAEMMHDTPLRVRPVILDGNTGTAKTRILQLLARNGWQVIDLEGLANHRGSALGARREAQPCQKLFEGMIAQRVARFDPAKPVIVEAESSRVGTLNVPPALWSAMKVAPRVVLSAPQPERARYLARSYADITADHAALASRLDLLRGIRGHAAVDRWQDLARNGAFEQLALELVQAHYDARYDRARRHMAGPDAIVSLDDLSEDGLAVALPRICAALERAGINAGG